MSTSTAQLLESSASHSSLPQDNPETQQPPSKKSIKRALKAERLAANKLERRAREKEARKQKKREREERRQAGELDSEEQEQEQNARAKRRKVANRDKFGGRVVIDLGFDAKMSEKEVVSLCSQLAYTYSTNRKEGFPFRLLYTSLGGKTLTRLEGVGEASYKRWSHTEWWTDSFEALWTPETKHLLPKYDPDASSADTVEVHHSALKEHVIYLTADSENELLELDPNDTYVIGGICDHNRYKNLCLDKANELGIRTARLPIGRYLANLQTRKVLTVNQVFEIMLKWIESRNWEEALESVIPKRKFKSKQIEEIRSEQFSELVQPEQLRKELIS